MAMITIRQALFPLEQEDVLSIFREYVNSATVNLEFQDYEAEFATLPGKYASPGGCLLLARENDVVLGCAALRRVDQSTGEMKRVYVRPAARGTGLGRRLVECLLNEARLAGYSRVCLDVLPEFQVAHDLYLSLGFAPAEAVSFNPVPGTRFLAMALRSR